MKGIILQKYMKKYRIRWRNANEKLLHGLKINGCAICGYNKYDACLDFHHVNPEDKKFQLVIDRMSRKDLFEELNKCILLCCRCHREIHEEVRLNEKVNSE